MHARTFVSLGILLFATQGFGQAASTNAGNFESRLPDWADRVWIGPDFWANRVQDWRVRDGRFECVEASSQRPMRTVQLLTANLREGSGEFVISVRLGALQRGGKRSTDTWAGFLIGAGSAKIDYRLTALVHHRPAEDGGILVAVDGTGKLIFRDNNVGGDADGSWQTAGPLKPNELSVLAPATRSGFGFIGDQGLDNIELRVEVRPDGDQYRLAATAVAHHTGQVLSSAELRHVTARDVEGSVALVSHLGPPSTNQGYWFRDWKMAGTKVVSQPSRTFGPIFAAQHTVSRGVLKLTAQLPPIGPRDTSFARLEVREVAGGPWRIVARANVTEHSYTLPFRVENWDATKDMAYRVAYDFRTFPDELRTSYWEGVIRKEPVDREQIVVAALGENRAYTGGLRWNHNGLWFPHTDVVSAVKQHRPDLLVFSGNQISELDETSVQHKPLDKAMLDYLDKWYRWCWAYGDLTRDTPSVCLPGDQDLFNAHLFGSGGRAAKTADDGGFVMPAEFVNLVQRTQTSHLPDPVDPVPVEQEIGVYFTRLETAGVSFAILEDRKFKSSPAVLLPEGKSASGVFRNPRFDATKQADAAGAELLGDRQLRFLREWAADWSGDTWMKVALSQSLFNHVATLPRDTFTDAAIARLRPPRPDEYPAGDRIVADADSNAWPQTGRNNALRELRRGFTVHIAGGRHLGSLIQYGVDDWNDAGFAFGVPSIASPAASRWFPPLAKNVPARESEPRYTGPFKDGFGNFMTVLAVANPVVSGREPAQLLDRAPGYGIIKFDRQTRETTFECWPRGTDPSQPDAKQFTGWPQTVGQLDNYNRAATALLPLMHVSGALSPVVQIVDEATSEIVYTVRINGVTFQPKVFQPGRYTIRIGELGTPRMKIFSGIEARKTNDSALDVELP